MQSLSEFSKSLPRLEELPFLVRFASGRAGRLSLCLVFTALVFACGKDYWLALGVVLAALSFWPSQRRFIVALATAGWLWQYPPFATQLQQVAVKFKLDSDLQFIQNALVIVFLLAAASIVYLSRRFPTSLFFAHATRNMIIVLILLILLPSFARFSGIAVPPGWPRLCIVATRRSFTVVRRQRVPSSDRSRDRR